MQEANGQQLDKNPPTAGKDEVVSKLFKSNKESSTNIVKWQPWFLLKGNKRFSWTYFLHESYHYTIQLLIQTTAINLVFPILSLGLVPTILS